MSGQTPPHPKVDREGQPYYTRRDLQHRMWGGGHITKGMHIDAQ